MRRLDSRRYLLACSLMAPLVACDEPIRLFPPRPDAGPRQAWAPPDPDTPPDPPPPSGQCLAETNDGATFENREGRRVRFRRADQAFDEQRTFDPAGRLIHLWTAWTETSRVHAWGLPEAGEVEVSLVRDADGRIVGRTVRSDALALLSESRLVEQTPEREIWWASHVGPYALDLLGQVVVGERSPDAAVRRDALGVLVDWRLAQPPLPPIEEGLAPVETEETRHFDAAGAHVRTTWDFDGDGTPDRAMRLLRSAQDWGRAEVQRVDLEADGHDDIEIGRSFDDADRLIEHRFTALPDGVPVVARRSFDGEGRLVREEALRWSIADAEVTDMRSHRWIEPAVRLTELPSGSNTWLTFRADGQRILKQDDYDGDHVVDWQKRYVHDADGRRVYDETDENMDGVPERRWDYVYDDDDLLVAETLRTTGRCD